MGRGKIEIKRIDNTRNRKTTYVKRRNGIIKKAEQISKLCEAQVSLLIVGPCRKFDAFCSSNTTLVDLLDNYQKKTDKPKLWDAKHENLCQEIEDIKKENDRMNIYLRHLNGDDIGSMHHTELGNLEKVLEDGFHIVQNKRVERYEMLQNNTKFQEEEYMRLCFHLEQQEMAKQSRMKEYDVDVAMEEKQPRTKEYHVDVAMEEKQTRTEEYHVDVDYSHMPFAFPILQHVK